MATLAALAVVGCSGSPRDEAKKALESLHSWAVSTQMVGERWMEGAVPDPYASKALQAFGKKVRKERDKIASGKLPADMKRYLVAAYDSTARTADSLMSDVDKGDRSAADILKQLSARARAADSLEGRLGAK
ncbi:MAG TPA: hypothetical protein VFK04_02670 [Gemmatimonadaceae bacterium]|nr:hypothetical protein [Gemmatimonadaceae bacterium]